MRNQANANPRKSGTALAPSLSFVFLPFFLLFPFLRFSWQIVLSATRAPTARAVPSPQRVLRTSLRAKQTVMKFWASGTVRRLLKVSKGEGLDASMERVYRMHGGLTCAKLRKTRAPYCSSLQCLFLPLKLACVRKVTLPLFVPVSTASLCISHFSFLLQKTECKPRTAMEASTIVSDLCRLLLTARS